MDGQTDEPTDGWTKPLLEVHVRTLRSIQWWFNNIGFLSSPQTILAEAQGMFQETAGQHDKYVHSL